MGIFDFILSKTSSNFLTQGQEGGFTHKRRHARYLINSRDLCTIEHPRHGQYGVLDISHHGCLVELFSGAGLDRPVVPLTVHLNLCGSSMRIEVAQCQRRRQGWGLVFRHDDEQSQKKLERFLNPLRMGQSAVMVEDQRQDQGRTHSISRKRVMGDGPFEVVFEKSQDGSVNLVMVTLRTNHGDGCVIWDRGSIITKKSSGTEGAMMPQSISVDEDLVWKSSVLCLGINLPDGPLMAQTLYQWILNQAKLQITSQKSG